MLVCNINAVNIVCFVNFNQGFHLLLKPDGYFGYRCPDVAHFYHKHFLILILNNDSYAGIPKVKIEVFVKGRNPISRVKRSPCLIQFWISLRSTLCCLCLRGLIDPHGRMLFHCSFSSTSILQSSRWRQRMSRDSWPYLNLHVHFIT